MCLHFVNDKDLPSQVPCSQGSWMLAALESDLLWSLLKEHSVQHPCKIHMALTPIPSFPISSMWRLPGLPEGDLEPDFCCAKVQNFPFLSNILPTNAYHGTPGLRAAWS